MLSDEKVEVDYDEPGSPLDRYLADLDLEFHPSAGLSQLENAGFRDQKTPPKKDSCEAHQNLGLFLLTKNLFSRMLRTGEEYLQGLKDNHLIKTAKLEYELRTILQQQLADFQLDDTLEILNDEIDRLHVLSTKEKTCSPFPKYAGHFFAIYLALIIKNAHSFPIWINFIHFLLASGGIIFLLNWLRYSVTYWSYHDYGYANMKKIKDMKETFDMIDRSLRKSLQFLRDIQVLSKGFTTIKSSASSNCNQSYSPKDAETMKTNMKSCLSFVCEKLAPESAIKTASMDSELEMLIIDYHERRSLFIRKTASQVLEDGLLFPSDSIKNEVRLLDCRTDRIRKVEIDSDNRQPVYPENPDPKHAVLRSLGIHAQLLAREAYEAETTKLLDTANIDNISRHAIAIAESFSLLLTKTSPESLVPHTKKKKCPTKRKNCQTSETADVEQLEESDPDDDLIFEEIVVHDADDVHTAKLRPQLHDDSNPAAQLGARNVISELKNILPKTVNPDSRRTRKEALFPEYWREKNSTSIRHHNPLAGIIRK